MIGLWAVLPNYFQEFFIMKPVRDGIKPEMHTCIRELDDGKDTIHAIYILWTKVSITNSNLGNSKR